jgi:Tfp pilus assembly protein PilX
MRRGPEESPSRTHAATPRKREQGIAMITVVLVIFLLMASALSSVDFTEQESRASGQSRATMRSLYAADAGIQLAVSRVQPPADTSAFSFNLADGTVVESRKRSDAAPQPIVDEGAGAPPDGYAVNIGSGYANQVYRLTVTAVGQNNLTSELEAKVGVLSVNSGSY